MYPINFDLQVSSAELNLDKTLSSGQAFLWRKTAPGCWEGMLGNDFVRLQQDKDILHVEASAETNRANIESFFRLDVSLDIVKASLCERDKSLCPLFEEHVGLRILRQDPMECLLTFICAVATSIPRIQCSIKELCSKFGRETENGQHLFPSIESLANAEPDALRVGGMEFRCKNLSQAAKYLQSRGGKDFLQLLKNLSYEEACEKLTSIPYVGRKIADCTLLFSLGFDEAFPLDTHTWRAACERYALPTRSRSYNGYKAASCALRSLLGPWAGWAQQYLYVSSLSQGRSSSKP